MAGDLAKSVGRNIRARRLAAGYEKQRELADQMASPTISNQTVSDWERGVNKPSDENLRELAAILGCQVADFYIAEAPTETPTLFEPSPSIEQRLEHIEQQLAQLLALFTREPDAAATLADAIAGAVEHALSQRAREVGRPRRSPQRTPTVADPRHAA